MIDLPLAPTLAPLIGDDPRTSLERLARLTFRHVQLPAAFEGLRPRDLDRSARRDLIARLRRMELAPAGLDLWIPEEHYTEAAHVDRVAAAVMEAIELGADLGRIPLSVRLPEGVDVALVESWRERAEVCGVAIADHGAWGGTLGAGVDPAALLAQGRDPAAACSQAGELISARLSDFRGEGRVIPGTGMLDLLAFQVALITRGYARPVVLDLRRLPDAWSTMEEARQAWSATGLVSG